MDHGQPIGVDHDSQPRPAGRRRSAASRIETALERAVQSAAGRRFGGQSATQHAPPKIAEAIRYAVFPGGARVRPRLCLAVAHACGDDHPELSDAAAAAIEMLHCASLVHDDLPCFDDAELRRGKSSVHRAFSEPLALLAGDALIIMAFETVAATPTTAGARLAPLVATLAAAAGSPSGLVAGQAWESEPAIPLDDYHRAKTASLFIGAASAGAIAAGADPAEWTRLGEKLGAAYQVADDLRDATADADELGKPVGQDAHHARPNAVARLGLSGALAHLQGLIGDCVGSIPACPGRADLEALILGEAKRLMPKKLAQHAA